MIAINKLLLLTTLITTTLSTTSTHDNVLWDWDDGVATARLFNRLSHIGIVAHVGTPPQDVELVLDTGSEITWLNTAENPYCAKGPISAGDIGTRKKGSFNCTRYGVFDTEKSSSGGTLKKEGKLEIRYLDHVTVEGSYYQDNVTIGYDLTLDEFKLGLASSANSSFGVLGLAPVEPEKIEGKKVTYKNHNVVRELQKSGKIDRAVFGVWLNDNKAKSGTILFGGVDMDKFEGKLTTMKMVQPVSRGHTPMARYEVVFSNIFHNTRATNDTGEEITHRFDVFKNSKNHTGNITSAVMDTGSSKTHLPQDLFETLVKSIDRAVQVKENRYVVECSGSDSRNYSTDSLTFKFAGSRFTIPMERFIDDMEYPVAHDIHGNYLDFSKKYCELNIVPTYKPYAVMGLPFLRSVYTVFDLDRMEISMAPARYTHKSHVKRLGIADPVGGEPESKIRGSEKFFTEAEMFDPNSDFIHNTGGGYNKHYRTNGAVSSKLVGSSWRSTALRMFVCATVVFMVV